MAPEILQRISGSPDLYRDRGPGASINFVTCHDGFTLYDLVSYNEKHNEANGEDNRDGSNDNNSWNCGVEGETTDPEIASLRMRQMKNMLTILMMSRGIPMILSGDEFANTQFGNNNAYCQDNEISWLDWSKLEENQDLFEYTKHLIAFRKSHPVLRAPSFDTGYNETGYPELTFHGVTPWEYDYSSHSLTIACLFVEDCLKYKTDCDSFIYLIINAHWEDHVYRLPIIPEGYRWKIELASSDDREFREELGELNVPARSVVLLVAAPV
jgi:glycogen operon protein